MAQIADIIRFSREHKMTLQKDIHSNYPTGYLQGDKKYKLNAMALLSLENPVELCRFLKKSILQLEEMINTPVYEHYTIKKKRGGGRHIFAPEKQLKQTQKRLNYFLQAYYLWIKPSEVHGFVINPLHLDTPPCNIVTNANAHKGKKHILNIDLKNFFPNISAKRIKNLFTSPYFNYNEQLAIALTLLTTYKGQLPTGAPTSPVLSNFVCLKLDAELRNFCKDNDMRFTRYADDLTFSSDTLISQDTILKIMLLIKKNGFETNLKKLRTQSSGRRQTVTGLTVNEKVNVDRKLLKKTRAMLHDLVKNGIETATRRHFNLKNEVTPEQGKFFILRLNGYINFIGQVRGENDSIYLKLKRLSDPFS
jgi:RNA-directed DNA polymerase